GRALRRTAAEAAAELVAGIEETSAVVRLSHDEAETLDGAEALELRRDLRRAVRDVAFPRPVADRERALETGDELIRHRRVLGAAGACPRQHVAELPRQVRARARSTDRLRAERTVRIELPRIEQRRKLRRDRERLRVRAAADIGAV